MRTLILIVYNLAFPVLFVLYLPVFLYKLFKRGHFRHGFLERFGIYSRAKKERLATLDRPVWVHAVSVGETVAALSFLQRWTELEPNRQFILSTTTTTGQKIARKKAPDNVVPVYCPVDFCLWVWLALRRLRPSAVVIFEVEYWPNLILLAQRRGLPVALVNGRMSDRSAAGYAKYRWLFRPIMGSLRLFTVQSQADRDRVLRVVDDDVPVHVCGTVKFDQVPDCHGGEQAKLLDDLFPAKDRILFMAASTHPGEEEVMAAAVAELRKSHPGLYMVLVPRHAERAGEIEPILTQAGLTASRLTVMRQEGRADDAPLEVLLADTTGEMMGFLEAADIVFMGKSLDPCQGGHNIIEPAIFGKPIIHGHHMENFRLVTALFRESDATLEVNNAAEFTKALARLIDDPAERERLGAASRRVVDQQRGATDRTIELLRPVL